MRRVQISDICICFTRSLYSRKQSWIIKLVISPLFVWFLLGCDSDGSRGGESD